MRMQCLTLTLTSLALLVGGCGSVTSETPVGDQIAHIDQSDWEGTWLMRPIGEATCGHSYSREDGRTR
jgi:uncharacterized protein YceK